MEWLIRKIKGWFKKEPVYADDVDPHYGGQPTKR